MDDAALRTLIQEKLRDGRLPFVTTPRFSGGPADGEVCDACDKPITKQQLIIAGMLSSDGRKDTKSAQFHLQCFEMWNEERRQPRAATAERGSSA